MQPFSVIGQDAQLFAMLDSSQCRARMVKMIRIEQGNQNIDVQERPPSYT